MDMTQHALVVILIAAAAVLILAGVFAMARRAERRRTERLRARFGPEYDRMVVAHKSRSKAERLLESRERRSLQIVVRSLPVEALERYELAWRAVQSHFVDTPGKAVLEADRLFEQLMGERGYPIGDFEQQAGDLSVHHPQVIENYRVAHLITDSERRGTATTEDLRKAIVQYRTLCEELLGHPVSYQAR